MSNGTGYSNGSELQGPSRVLIEFHSSATKGGAEAYKVLVTSEATEQDVDEAARLAARARQKALAELAVKAAQQDVFPEHTEPEQPRGANGGNAAPRCKDCDSVMTYREGKSKANGKPFAGWFCPAADPGLAGHEPVWTKPKGQQKRAS